MPVWTGQASSRVGICEQDTVRGGEKEFRKLGERARFISVWACLVERRIFFERL